jgi:hypothetical protein
VSDRTPTTAVYLPDPANDETLTMSGYDWWRYRAAIEAEARAPLDVDVERLRAFAEAVAKSEDDTAGTRAAAKYALTGTLNGAIDEMRAALEEPTP